MRRIVTTVFGVLAIMVLLSMRTQVKSMPLPFGLFNLITLVMIILIVISLVRAWLQGL